MALNENIADPEYIKAGYIYNLTQFIYWPKNAFNFSVSPFIIGLYGNQKIDNALFSNFRNKKIQEREWKAEIFHSPESLSHCHLLFISGIEYTELRNLISKLANKHILSIADNIDGFCQIGGMINLVGTHPNYGYHINLKSLSKERLIVLPELTELATLIE